MRTPRLLDLFCGAGGAGMGYARAGFEVVGVDLLPQPRYPFVYYQDDALHVLDLLLAGERWHGYRLADFQVIHASPVCKGYSRANHVRQLQSYPLLIEPTRERLEQTRRPWVLENVVLMGKWRGLMPTALELCGTMFDLKVYRHRYFESSHLLFAPRPCTHPTYLLDGYVCVYGDCVRGRQKGNRGNAYPRYSTAYARVAMGITWMTLQELSQAIPPAYTEWVGRQLLEVLA